MPPRIVDGPRGNWFSAAAAARWLGLAEKTFRKEAADHPDLLPPTFFGKNAKWHWMDLVGFDWWRKKHAGKQEK